MRRCAIAHSRPAAKIVPLPRLSGPSTRTEMMSAPGRQAVDDPGAGRPVTDDVDRLGVVDDDGILLARLDAHAPDELAADRRMVPLDPRVDDRDGHARCRRRRRMPTRDRVPGSGRGARAGPTAHRRTARSMPAGSRRSPVGRARPRDAGAGRGRRPRRRARALPGDQDAEQVGHELELVGIGRRGSGRPASTSAHSRLSSSRSRRSRAGPDELIAAAASLVGPVGLRLVAQRRPGAAMPRSRSTRLALMAIAACRAKTAASSMSRRRERGLAALVEHLEDADRPLVVDQRDRDDRPGHVGRPLGQGPTEARVAGDVRERERLARS